jgi:glycerophosphoryl diester phosphodiesterase
MTALPRPSEVAVSAHQGGSESAPGGTFEAYRSSVETGAEYVEFDIRRTADGEFVVYHDDHVTSDHASHAGKGRTPVGQLTRPRLNELAGYPVPLVGEVMELITGNAVGHLDLKDVGGELEVISLALDILGADGFVATTLEDVSVARIKRHFPRVRTALSLGRDLTGVSPVRWIRTRCGELFPLRRIRDCGADWVAVHHRLATATVLATCARHAIGAMVWTVNDEASIDRFLSDRRVSVLITDRPGFTVRRRTVLAGAG